MKDLFIKLKKPIIIFAVLIALFTAYNMFVKKDDGALIEPGTKTVVPGADFLPLLLRIKDVSFDLAFFDDTLYKTLQDFSQRIVPEEEGKTNPFAPISGVSASSSVEGLGFEDQEAPVATSTRR